MRVIRAMRGHATDTAVAFWLAPQLTVPQILTWADASSLSQVQETRCYLSEVNPDSSLTANFSHSPDERAFEPTYSADFVV
jgi:hypothetical protein